MQGYTYSVFSGLAIAIHLIINSDLIAGRGIFTERGRSYRGFLLGILAYYTADAAWGVLAGLGWSKALYVETVFFFLSMVVLVIAWNRYVAVYTGLGKRQAKLLDWASYAILAFNVVALAANPFTGWVYAIDSKGVYLTGPARDPAFYLLIGYMSMMSAILLVNAVQRRESERRRMMMAFMFSLTLAVAMVFQVAWPLTPFTALGCLIGNCFLHVFVVQDEQTARHMAELEKALSRARAAENARRMFFSIVSHDIRTPLNAMLGYSELLQYGIKNKFERDEALKSIHSSGTALLQLVNDVLDLAKIDAGMMELHPESVRLGDLVDDVLAAFRLAAGKKGISLVNKAGKLPPLMLDAHRLRQVLFNLVGNAVKFTSRGSIEVAASYSGGRLSLSVSDTGCGIPPGDLERILDPFVQVSDPSHSADRAGGTGLGLTICRRLVEMMGGELTVESELGKGSKFTAKVPGVIATGGPAPKESAPPAPKKLPSRVLVVDDSPVNRSMLTAFLIKAGVASVEHASDGTEALEELDAALAEGKTFDFVFTDFWMPNMNGMELVERLRGDPRFAELPVCAVTADMEFGHDRRAKLFSAILMKPFTYAKLLEVFSFVTLPGPACSQGERRT